MDAVAGYLQKRRELCGLSRAQLAARLSVNESSIYRIETGKREPSAAMLIGMLDVAQGSFDHIKRLLRDKHATREDGMRLAHELDVALAQQDEDQRDQLIASLRHLLHLVESGQLQPDEAQPAGHRQNHHDESF